MPFFKDDPLNVKYKYAASRVLYDDEEAQDNSSLDSDEDDGPTAWDAENAGNSDTDSVGYSGGSSSNGSKSEYRGEYGDGSTAWDTEMAGNSDTGSGSGSGSSSSGSKSVDSTGKGKGKERGAGRGKWFKKLRMIFDGLQLDEKKEKPRKKVKSILRPPVRFTYVTGMSGITSRVPVFKM
ncbi:uncharacterized protein LOC126834731 [Adelges cooleyi]|uniref:uncharacterized protein LOC126834731 n=1 Tax=Adelges cooleyi TaxID=133065 RepID=UPI00217F27D8|nr:uncharacterized protein LOC126834731 [Adelges cooleyi]